MTAASPVTPPFPAGRLGRTNTGSGHDGLPESYPIHPADMRRIPSYLAQSDETAVIGGYTQAGRRYDLPSRDDETHSLRLSNCSQFCSRHAKITLTGYSQTDDRVRCCRAHNKTLITVFDD